MGIKWKIFDVNTPITSDIYLIAKFSVNSVKVSAVSESERKGTVTGSKVYEYGSLATLEAIANPGYSFAYWTKDDETTVISNEPTYTFKVEKEVSFKAHFNTIEYNISYNNVTEEELIASGNKRLYTIEEPKDIELKNPYRSGYSFKGWYTTSDFQIATKIERIAKGTIGDKHLYAKWEQSTNTRIVVFDTICITEILSPIEVEMGKTIVEGEYTPDKYNPVWADFDAWYYKDSTGTEQKFIFGPDGTGTVVNEDMYVYAKYTKVYDEEGTTGLTYSINSNGGYTASCFRTHIHSKTINIPCAVKFQNYYVLVNEIGDMGHFTWAVTINVPPTVKLINDRAFNNLYRLDEVKFISNGNDKNSQLLCIGANAFYNSNIKKIVLPSNLLAIYENAFEDCDELISVYIDSDIVANFTDNSSYVFIKNKTREGIQRVVYVNKNITVNDTSYLKTEGYTVGTEVEGYIPYTKASKVSEE